MDLAIYTYTYICHVSLPAVRSNNPDTQHKTGPQKRGSMGWTLLV